MNPIARNPTAAGQVYDILKWFALIALPAVAWLSPEGSARNGTATLRRTRYDHQRDRFCSSAFRIGVSQLTAAKPDSSTENKCCTCFRPNT